MIRRISRDEARSLSRRMRAMDSRCCGSSCRRKDEKEDENACDALEVEALVDLAVDALAEFGVEEIDYEEMEEEDRPDENEAICTDEEGNEVGVTVDGKKITIDLDEDEDIVVKLDQPVDDVKAEIKDDLEAKLAEQEEAEESNRRFEAWKRVRSLRKEGKRVGRKDR